MLFQHGEEFAAGARRHGHIGIAQSSLSTAYYRILGPARVCLRSAEIKWAAGPVPAEVVCVELVLGELLVQMTSFFSANETKVCRDKISYTRC